MENGDYFVPHPILNSSTVSGGVLENQKMTARMFLHVSDGRHLYATYLAELIAQTPHGSKAAVNTRSTEEHKHMAGFKSHWF